MYGIQTCSSKSLYIWAKKEREFLRSERQSKPKHSCLLSPDTPTYMHYARPFVLTTQGREREGVLRQGSSDGNGILRDPIWAAGCCESPKQGNML